MGETLDTGRDAEIQHKLVTGSRFRGTEWKAFVFHIVCTCRCVIQTECVLFFISVVVSFPARLLSEDVVQDT